MAVSAAEFDNHTGNTKRDNLLAIDVDSGASEHYFDDTPGLRGRLSEYEVLEEPRKITTACLLYTSPSPRDKRQSRMPSSA